MAELADQALLFAKRSGRNRVTVFSEIDRSETPGDSGRGKSKPTLQTTSAGDIMTNPILTVSSAAPLKEAAEILLQSRLSSIPVVDEGGTLVGTISEKDLLVACIRRELHETVDRRMATNVVRFDEDATAQIVFDFFCRSTIRRVFVTSSDQPVGLISRGMLLRYMINSDRLGLLGVDAQDDTEPTKAGGSRRGVLAETAGILGKELGVLRDRIAPQASGDDASLIDIVSRIEELMSDLLRPRDLDAFSADHWRGQQQPWSV